MFKIASHRGGNSWGNIFQSIQNKYDYMELDVHLTADNYLVVQYSPTIKINECNVYIQDIKYKMLSSSTKKQLLLLSDVLSYAKGKIGVIIDIKRGYTFYHDIGIYVANLIEKMSMYTSTWIISFDHYCLIQAKKYNSNVQIALMYVARPYNEQKYWLEANADGIEVCNDYLVSQTVELAHNNNVKLIGWCTKNFDELKWLAELKIDIITVDMDKVFINYLKTLERYKNE